MKGAWHAIGAQRRGNLQDGKVGGAGEAFPGLASNMAPTATSALSKVSEQLSSNPGIWKKVTEAFSGKEQFWDETD